MITYTLKVVAVVNETEDAHTICFKPPTFKKIKYISGQYVTVIVSVNNKRYKRPYSLSSAPGIDDTLNITVKRLPYGIVSNHLIDMIKEGDILEVMEPIGDFIYQNDIHGDYDLFLWATGSGITPLMSILKTALSKTQKNVTLFYSNKTFRQIIFYDQLIQLKNKYPDQLLLNLHCTEEDIPYFKYGRINPYNIIEDLKNTIDINNTIHYICGHVDMKNAVKDELTRHGLSKNQIFSEDFKHIINEKEFAEIQTQFVKLKMGNETFDIEVIRGKSILEACLDHQIDLLYSCQTGSCTLCKGKLNSGEVKKIAIEAPEQELEENEILLCCSYPLTNNIIFEID